MAARVRTIEAGGVLRCACGRLGVRAGRGPRGGDVGGMA